MLSRPGRRVPSIRATLVRLVLVCVLPLALTAAALIFYVYLRERESLTDNALNRTRAVAYVLDRELPGSSPADVPRAARLLAAQKLLPSWRAALIDTDARILARSHDPQTFVGKPVMPDLRRHIADEADGSYESVTLDGVPVLTVFSRAPVTGRTVAVGIPLAELRASLYRGIGLLILFTIVATALGLLTASLIARRVAGSLTALIAPATSLGGDTPLSMPAPHFAEAGILGDALVTAHAKLLTMRAGLRSSEQRLDLATQATGVGIWVRDRNGAVVWASAQWRKLFGFGADEPFRLDDVFARIHADDRDAARTTLLRIAALGGSYDIEYRLAMPDGGQRWIASRGRLEIGDVPGAGAELVLGISSDVSVRILAELALQRKQEQVVHLSRVSMVGELSGALAHEINQPLTAILSNAQAAQRLIERSAPPIGEIRDILADIVAEDRRAAEVIRRLRNLLRDSAVSREAVDVDVLAAEVVGLLRNELLNRDIKLAVDTRCDGVAVSGDKIQLQQVLINLIVNGCDAIDSVAAASRKIHVAIAGDEAGITFTVHDGGPGIEPQRLHTIFEPFHSTKPDGMGLGLSICRKIVGAHGGTIGAANHPAGGALFTVTIPP